MRSNEVHPEAEGPLLQAQAEAELTRFGFGLRFPPALEARYRTDTAADRARHLNFISRIGVSLYVIIGVLQNLLIIGHPPWMSVSIQLGGCFLLVLLLSHYCFRADTPDGQREAAIFICCLACELGAIWVVLQKPVPLIGQDCVLAAMPLNFILIFIRLRFTAATALASISALAYAAVLALHPHVTGIAFPLGFIVLICVPSLVGLHAIERGSRRDYLHGLLQSLRNDRLATEIASLADLSATDPLTGIANRRKLDAALAAFCSTGRASGALMLIDIDAFKAINDRYGHPAGDQCLREVAQCLTSRLRPGDLLARMGGEEFAVLLPGMTPAEATEAAERLRQAVEVLEVMVNGAAVRVTISVGVAAGEADSALLMARADSALYLAKGGGRNRVSCACLETTT
jgi:diguanylate cyclase (GGDEF)-like protein